MTRSLTPLSAQIVGSYAKPNWLINGNQLARVRRFEPDRYWRPATEVLLDAQQDAARLAIYEQQNAGLSVVTDGESFRHTYDTSFLLRMTGIDFEQRAPRPLPRNEILTMTRVPRSDTEDAEDRQAPRLLGEPNFRDHATAAEVTFARTVTDRPLKVAVVGPFTAFTRVFNEHYHTDREAVLAFARALNTELMALQEAGADILQIDEPLVHQRLSAAENVITEAINVAVQGIFVPTIVHVCYGYVNYIASATASPTYERCLSLVADSNATAISLAYQLPEHAPTILKACRDKHVLPGVLDLNSQAPEDVDRVEARIRGALNVVPAERLHPSVDCGMWFLPRDVAADKIRALGEATARVRAAGP